MKKILLLVAIFATTLLSAQTGGYWVQEFKAKMNTGNDLTEAFDKIFKDSKFNKGAIVLSELTTGSQGMTHRIAWQFTIGTDMMEKDAISPDKWDAFFSKLTNYVEVWGPSYSGRLLGFQMGDHVKNATVHIWDVKIKDPTKFKAAHDVLLKELKDDFTGRDVGFGTYDIGRPNGATHWMYLSGKDGEDHLKLYDKLEKSAEFWKYIKDRGEVVDVKDFELKYLKIKQ
jgi:hypothetical protein